MNKISQIWKKKRLDLETTPLGQALSMLDSSEKKKLGFVCVIQTLLGFLDLVGVAIIGLVGTLAVNGIQSESPVGILAEILEILHLSNFTFQLQVALLGLIAATILILRSLFSMFLSRKILFFLSYKAATMSSRLVRELLSRNMTEIQRRTSQETLYSVTTGVGVLMLNVVAASAAVFADTFLLFIFSVGLFVFDPLMATSTLVLFGLVSVILYFTTQKKASLLGEYSSQITISSNKKILEVINSFREIYVHDLQQNYANHIAQTRNELAEASAKLTFIPNISKYVIEITLVAGGVGISAIQFLMHDAIQAVSTLAVFLAAASRIAPAILRLQSGSLAIKSSVGIARSTLELINVLSPFTDRIVTTKQLVASNSDFKASVSIKDVSFSYSNSGEPTLKDIFLEVTPGSQVAIVGSSGAGKSTLVDLILGLRGDQNGRILIGGLVPGEAIKKWPGGISYVPQSVYVSDSTILSNIAFGYDEINMDSVWDALEIAQLSDFVQSLPLGVHTQVGESGNMVSGGERQRLGIARALYTKPKLLILDEATSSLDAQTEVAISNAMSRLRGDTTIIMIAHRLSSVKNADQVVYIQDGEIVSRGSFSDVKSAVPDFEKQAKLMGL